jgi:hypothetical protein
MTDYKELCAELVNELEGWCGTGTYDNTENAHSVIDRARDALGQPEPEGPSDEELLAVAAGAINPYETCGIAIGEYEAETECAIEVYGSELIAFARAVLARWGNL